MISREIGQLFVFNNNAISPDYFPKRINENSRPVTRILCEGGGGANEAEADPTTEMYFLSSDPFI